MYAPVAEVDLSHENFDQTTDYAHAIRNNYVYFDGGSATVRGGTGNDTIIVGNAENYGIIEGNEGDDIINASEANNVYRIFGGDGNDTLDGGDGIDTIVFGDSDATVNLLGWNNNKAQDTGHGLDIIATQTIENITSGLGHDTLTGQWLNNVLDGGSGNDALFGSYGDDELIGGFGDDTLTGGFGDDTLTGGSGNDTFVLSKAQGTDLILDFNPEEDQFELQDLQVSDLSFDTDRMFGLIKVDNKIKLTATDFFE